jgi:hypothetical protein
MFLLFAPFFHLCHDLFPGALWTNDVALVLDEALPHHGLLAEGAEEAIVMPGKLLKGDELGAPEPTATWRNFKD